MRPSAKYAVTVLAGVIELIGGLADSLLISALRGFVSSLAGGLQFQGELDPIRIGNRHKPAVLATAAGSQHQLRRLRHRDCGVVDNLPTLVDSLPPR